MLTVGHPFPRFSGKAVVSDAMVNGFIDLDQDTYAGKWKVYFFWPKDFSFICPTEIAGFSRLNEEFTDRDTQVIGVSTDNEFVHRAWRQQNEHVKDLPFPMYSDISRRLSEQLGILDAREHVCLRATFIVDDEDIIRHVSVNDMKVGRNPDEILRVLDALQSDAFCPCNWQKGEACLSV